MAIINWGENFSVNVVPMDDQHKNLVSIMDRLDAAIREQRSALMIEPVINELFSSAALHTTAEEELLKISHYPELTAHKKMHSFFIREIFLLKHEFSSGREMNARNVLRFIRDWFLHHISNADRKYGEFLH